MATNPTPSMNLPVPEIGVEPGPAWAQDLNNCMSIIDTHNHVFGSGVQIPPGGLNINSDLTFNSNNAVSLRSVRFTPQSAPLSGASDIGCLYESGVDLWYNDGNTNQIRITASGNVVGAPGQISGLGPPASAVYNSGNETFVWESNSNTPANMDAGSYIFRNITPGSNGVTVSPPNSLGSNYTLVLPTIPAQTNVMTLDASGNMGSITYDQVGENMSSVGANAIQETTTRSAGTTVGLLGVAVSNSSGNFSTTSATPTAVTNLSVTIVTSGRPIKLALQASGSAGGSLIAASSSTGTSAGTISFVRASTTLSYDEVIINSSGNSGGGVPPSSFSFIDVIAAGTYTYTVLASNNGSGTSSIDVFNAVLTAYEL